MHKPLDSVSPRLQRLLLRLQSYDAHLVFMPGRRLIAADVLFRTPLVSIFVDTSSLDTRPSACLLVGASCDTYDFTRAQAAADRTLHIVIKYVQDGWPEKRKVHPSAHKFWDCRDELYCEERLLGREICLVLQAAAQPAALQKLRMGHRGISACKVRAREALYWPWMTQDVENMLKHCITCQRNMPVNHYEPLMDIPLPTLTWQQLVIDLFRHDRSPHLLVIDYYSKYVEVEQLSSTAGRAVICSLKKTYARFTIPQEIMTDNGPPFDSKELASFNASWSIQRRKSLPHYPRSSGQAERAISTINAFFKAQESGEDLNISLLNYRTTSTTTLLPPAKTLAGRRISTLLPIHPNFLIPNYPATAHHQGLQAHQNRKSKHGDRHTSPMKPFEPGQRV